MEKSDFPKIYALTPRFTRGQLLRWSVNLVRRGNRLQREFQVAAYGGVEEAKQAALAYRDELLKTISPLSLREFGCIVRRSNTSGVPGVTRRVDEGHARWIAIVYLPNGRSRKKTYAIKKYGEEKARQLAIEARQAMLQTLEGWLVQHPDAGPRGQKPPDVDCCAIALPCRKPSVPAKPRMSPQRRVYRYVFKRLKSNGQQWSRAYWIAECARADGKTVRKFFATERHGEEQARQLALSQRRQWLEQLSTGGTATDAVALGQATGAVPSSSSCVTSSEKRCR